MPLPIRHPLSRQVAARTGFTLIELLVVIAIIGIISGITVVGLKYVAAGAEGNQTKTRLEALKSAFAAVTNSKDGERKLYTIVLPGIYFVDASNKPAAPASATNKTWVAVPAYGVEALYRSGKVYKALKSNPEFAAIINGLNADQKVKFLFNTTSMQIVPAGTAGAEELEFPLDAWKKPILFAFDNLQTATSATSTLPLVVDTGSGNTPTGGLTYLYSESGKEEWRPDVPFNPLPTVQGSSANTDLILFTRPYGKPTTITDRHKDPQTLADAPALRAPDRLPFFYSAGPDGKYETHDDNVYSFGN